VETIFLLLAMWNHRNTYPICLFVFLYLLGLFGYSIKIPTFTPLEQGKFLSEKHRNEAGAKVGASIGRFL